MINFLHIDCMEFMKTVPDKHYDLAIVDPPYGIDINVNMGRRKGNKKSSYHKFHGEDKNIPNGEYFHELNRISKNQIIWGGNYMTDNLKPSPCWVLWDKGFSEDVTFAQYEMAWASFSTSAKKFEFNAAKNKNRIHPTQKPIALYEWLLKNYAKPGQSIIDTHGGSFSHAIAVHNMNAKDGMNLSLDIMEIDEEYYQKGVERYQKHIQQLTIFQ